MQVYVIGCDQFSAGESKIFVENLIRAMAGSIRAGSARRLPAAPPTDPGVRN
jgi:hypothetical protein